MVTCHPVRPGACASHCWEQKVLSGRELLCRQKSSLRVYNVRKLLLVLDLDHTLLNSTRFEEVPTAQMYLTQPTWSCGLLVCSLKGSAQGVLRHTTGPAEHAHPTRSLLRETQVSDGDRERLTGLLKQQCALPSQPEPANAAEVSEQPSEEAVAEDSATEPAQAQTLFCLTHMGLWTKLRPFVRVCMFK